MITLLFIFLGASFSSFSVPNSFAVETLHDEVGKTSSRKGLVLFERYLNLLQLRYVNDEGKWDGTKNLNERDIKNINNLYETYLKVQPLQPQTISEVARVTLVQGMNELKQVIRAQDNALAEEREGLKDIPIEGEHDPVQKHIATLTRLVGPAEFLTHPSTKVEGEGPHAKFAGKYYLFHAARVGDRLESDDILRIGAQSNAKARLIFKNGDQIELGAGTAYRMSWNSEPKKSAFEKLNFGINVANAAEPKKDPASDSARLDLLFGRMRTVIKRGAERKGLQVRTRSAIIGVRGTDFFLNDKEEGTQVVVMRGRVNCAAQSNPNAPIDILPGYLATVPAPERRTQGAHLSKLDQSEMEDLDSEIDYASKFKMAVSETKKIQTRPVSASDLNSVREISVPPPPAAPGTTASILKVDPQAPIEVRLEARAFQMVLKDVRNDDPEFYAELRKAGVNSLDELNLLVLQKLSSKPKKSI